MPEKEKVYEQTQLERLKQKHEDIASNIVDILDIAKALNADDSLDLDFVYDLQRQLCETMVMLKTRECEVAHIYLTAANRWTDGMRENGKLKDWHDDPGESDKYHRDPSRHPVGVRPFRRSCRVPHRLGLATQYQAHSDQARAPTRNRLLNPRKAKGLHRSEGPSDISSSAPNVEQVRHIACYYTVRV